MNLYYKASSIRFIHKRCTLYLSELKEVLRCFPYLTRAGSASSTGAAGASAMTMVSLAAIT